MLYTAAREGWEAGKPLAADPSRQGLYRLRADAEAVAAGRPVLAVALRYDPDRGVVVPAGGMAWVRARGW